MPVSYETWLVLLSIVMAIQGAYVGLSLAVQIGEAPRGCGGACCWPAPRSRSPSPSGPCISSACWRRACRFQVDYLVFPTLLSFLVCVIVVGLAVFATSAGPLTLLRLDAVGVPHGQRHFHHALHRHERAQRQRPSGP